MSLSFLPDDRSWICQPCGVPMEPGIVELEYLGNAFRVELLACPKCGAPLVTEDLALGRMLEVEGLLEDK